MVRKLFAAGRTEGAGPAVVGAMNDKGLPHEIQGHREYACRDRLRPHDPGSHARMGLSLLCCRLLSHQQVHCVHCIRGLGPILCDLENLIHLETFTEVGHEDLNVSIRPCGLWKPAFRKKGTVA